LDGKEESFLKITFRLFRRLFILFAEAVLYIKYMFNFTLLLPSPSSKHENWAFPPEYSGKVSKNIKCKEKGGGKSAAAAVS